MDRLVFRSLRINCHAADRVHGSSLFRDALTMQIAAGVHGALRLFALLYTPVGYLPARGTAEDVSAWQLLIERRQARFLMLMEIPSRWYKLSMQQEVKENCLQRLARIEGQVRGIARMVGEDRYCIDILTQIAAVQAALGKVEREILQNHVNTCVEHAIASGNAEEQRRKVAELMEVLNRSLG